jgi:hypothetical protein
VKIIWPSRSNGRYAATKEEIPWPTQLSFSKKDAEITLVGGFILKDRVAEKAEFVKRRTIEGKLVKLIHWRTWSFLFRDSERRKVFAELCVKSKMRNNNYGDRKKGSLRQEEGFGAKCFYGKKENARNATILPLFLYKLKTYVTTYNQCMWFIVIN